jgi:hypothetical protein
MEDDYHDGKGGGRTSTRRRMRSIGQCLSLVTGCLLCSYVNLLQFQRYAGELLGGKRLQGRSLVCLNSVHSHIV